MRDTAQVLEVNQNGSVLVIPFITNACISCTNSGCGKRGSPFTAANPNGLPLAPGMTVRISAKKRYQALQAVTALCVPLVCAAAGWFVSAKLARMGACFRRAGGNFYTFRYYRFDKPI